MDNYKNFFLLSFIFPLFFVWMLSGLIFSFVSAENGNKMLFFNKNLKIGDKNEDIRELQKILNKNTATQVSSLGIGSPGNETDFFGQLTKNAVIRFQELYASDILRPSGLASGTGFVGAATRLKLNSLSKLSQTNTAVSGSSNSSVSYRVISEPEKVAVRVYNTSEYQVLPGSTVILTGEGFDSRANTVFLGEARQIPNLSANEEGTKISFVVPKDLPLGKYSISVENSSGTSKNQKFDISFIVTKSPAKRPMVENITPSIALYDGEIMISGSGFTPSGNGVYSSFGNSLNISSSDGKTLKLKTSSLSEIHRLYEVKGLLKGKSLEGHLYVSNENGISKIPAVFYVKI